MGLNYGKILEETRAVLKKRRGWLGRVRDKDRFTANPSPSDDLHTHLETQEQLLKKGTVVWAAFVQANERLYTLDDHWYPAELVCSNDPHFDTHAVELERVGEAIFALKGTTPDDEHLRKMADELTGEMARSFSAPVPPSLTRKLTRGTDIRRYSVIVDRGHLPERVLAERMVPVLTHPECANVMLLPSSNWGGQMLELWKIAEDKLQLLREEYDRNERERMSRPMMDVTPAAIASLRNFADSGGEPVYIQVWYEGGHALNVIDSESIEPGDHQMAIDGVTFVMDAESAKKIWGCRLDWSEHGDVAGFSFE